MIWNKEIECADKARVKEIQLENLKAGIKRVEDHPFYKERFAKAGVTSEKIKSLEDLKYLPFLSLIHI